MKSRPSAKTLWIRFIGCFTTQEKLPLFSWERDNRKYACTHWEMHELRHVQQGRQQRTHHHTRRKSLHLPRIRQTVGPHLENSFENSPSTPAPTTRRLPPTIFPCRRPY